MSISQANLNDHDLFKSSMIDNFLSKGKGQFDIAPMHPVQEMQNDQFKKEQMFQMKKYSQMFGAGYAFQLCMERNYLANMRRMYPLKSNNTALNIHLGSYDKIDYSDYLGTDKPFDVDENIFKTTEKIYFSQ